MNKNFEFIKDIYKLDVSIIDLLESKKNLPEYIRENANPNKYAGIISIESDSTSYRVWFVDYFKAEEITDSRYISEEEKRFLLEYHKRQLKILNYKDAKN